MDALYSHRSQLILGFHGCDSLLAKQVVLGKTMLKKSMNDYDWLGPGIYFWENNLKRAMQWAEDNSKRKGSRISIPAAIGAFIDLGNCLDLTDSDSLEKLKVPYYTLCKTAELAGIELPDNIDPITATIKDRIYRKLDCAVIQTLHKMNSEAGIQPFDTVRGVFWEGNSLYEGAGFREKNHIQIAVINPNCIKGLFLPRVLDKRYPNP